MSNIAIAIHGGAGGVSQKGIENEQQIHDSLQAVLTPAFDVLKNGGSALDAVEAAVRLLENDPLYNAGRGSCLNSEGKVQLDAAIMNGADLTAGALACVRFVKNPISLARIVMERTNHVLISGTDAEGFAREMGVELESGEYFITEKQLKALKKEQEKVLKNEETPKKFGTVGAVALDKDGNLAAATSTGGITNKKYGRIGDSPLTGIGNYANNNTCAVSCTGDGEFFIRAVVAYDVSCLMEYKGLSLKEACEVVIHDKVKKLGGEGGLIAIDNKGNIELPFNSGRMARGFKTGAETFTAVYE